MGKKDCRVGNAHRPPVLRSSHRSPFLTSSHIFLTTLSMSFSILCSQILITFQPMCRNLAKFRWSLFRVSSIFFFQNFGYLCFHCGNLYPCQKSPSKNTTSLAFGKTMSGLPGRFLTCFRKRKPRLCSSDRTILSGLVFLPFMRDIR